MVYVLDSAGRPLMPCSPAKASHLLDDKKAKVKQRTPFTIQLLYSTTHYVQPVILGVDAGSKTIGLSASTEKKELFAAEVLPRNDVVNNLSTRREFRRARRNRKTRYRAPRFSNRVHSKHKGWLAPSVEVKIQEHITAIKRICSILPISKVVVETAEFDTQKLKAFEKGEMPPVGEDYCHGEMYGCYNVRQYVFYRDGYTCQCCGAHGKGIKLHAHHTESRKTGGNSPDVLVTVCEVCHKKYHKGIITSDKLSKRKYRSLRDATFMGIMRKTLLQRLQTMLDIPVIETRGYITKAVRTELLKLPKSHINDALAISQGPHSFCCDMGTVIQRAERNYTYKPVRHHNRQLHKATINKGGTRKSNQAPKYVKGFRLFDKVKFQGIECFVWGRRTSGYFSLKKLDGQVIHTAASWQKLKLLERSTNYLIQ